MSLSDYDNLDSQQEELSQQKDQNETLYNLAKEAMQEFVTIYLDLTRKTNGLANIKPEFVQTEKQRLIVLSGIDSNLKPSVTTPEETVQEWQRRQAIPFDVETAITKGVYIQLRAKVEELLDKLEEETQGFSVFDSTYIKANPYMLPILQRLANISSKAGLKESIGNVSDNLISESAATKLAIILNSNSKIQNKSKDQVVQTIEPTLEGIIRDLVGRILLESIVSNALNDANILYKRESQYTSLEGVVYNFRADFVIPDENSPKAFIEVRKSSSRHASLYAKDKMFSAINWKGRHKKMLAILVVDGPWTSETLRVMAKVFDYIVPLSKASDIAAIIKQYLEGDQSKLKWLIDFTICEAVAHNSD